MQAAVLRETGQPLAVEEVPDPVPGPDEVVVQTRTCGICRTDLHIQDGLAYVPRLPHVPGHEPAGVVAAVGRDVAGFAVGQAVVPHLFVWDAARPGRQPRLRGILGVTLPGGFAQFFKAPARNLLPLPDGVPFDLGGLTSCAVITAVHAFRKANLSSLDTALVLGAGGIGLILVQLLRGSGVRTAVMDRSPASLEAAREAGAALAVAPDDPTSAEQVRAWAGQDGDGVDCVFELVGQSQTMKAAAAVTARGGRIIVIGEEAEFPAIDTITLAQRELQVIGSRNGGMRDAYDALDLLARGAVRPPLAGHFPLRRVNDALGLARSGRVPGRVVLTLSGDD
jgi:propanol-preferring alcohol dehydrogenase